MQARSPGKGGPGQGPAKEGAATESQGPARESQGPASGSGGAARGKGSARKCPICGKPAIEASRPFCSERCRDVDLNRWLSNSYAIPGRPEADEDED